MSDDQEPLDIELANLKKLNAVIEQVNTALDASALNTEKVDSTVQNADRLLDLWIRVLARSDQAQKLILDENWQGATSDLQAIEAEQSQASRKAQEQQQYQQARREQEEREALERQERAERERTLSSTSSARGRGSVTRGRGAGRGTVKKEVVSAYAQTARPKASTSARPPVAGAAPTTSSRSVNGTTSSSNAAVPAGRGRGVPIAVRGTRASRGRQQGLGRSASAEQPSFK